jgi:glutamate--cysteine ligase catalytic subunit
MKSIRERRGDKVKILVPIYPDENTNMTVATHDEPYPGSIYMDAMGFGMGCSCLQITYETRTLNHARYLHDALLPFTPILAALSASAPIYKGKLSDIDMRWNVISQSVDCRTEEERNPQSEKYIPKSRYSTINHYISNHEYTKKEYFDTIQYKVSNEHMEHLMKNGGMDERLAFHIASLFVRDPIPSYSSEFEFDKLDDSRTLAHFENL